MTNYMDGLASPEERNRRLGELLEEHNLKGLKYICAVDFRVTIVTSDGNLEAVGDSEMEALEMAFARLRRGREALGLT